MLRPDLQVLCQGIDDGRRAFANTLEYIGVTTSANFGNMVSMALATPLLPFLPLAAKQILLNNFLSDLPSIALAGDRVDDEHLRSAQRWDVSDLRRYMLVFGLTSTVLALLTFGLLLQVFDAGEAVFQTAGFVVSLLTEPAMLLVLHTRLPAWHAVVGRHGGRGGAHHRAALQRRAGLVVRPGAVAGIAAGQPAGGGAGLRRGHRMGQATLPCAACEAPTHRATPPPPLTRLRCTPGLVA